MDRDNQQIPGFGFDPGYEPIPIPQQPAPSSNSIFGLISEVNKGILKHPDKSASETVKECPVNQSVEQARAVAKKLSNISPQVAKQRAFQNAKTTIENIQKGVWNVPAAKQNKLGSSNTVFKVPTIAPVQKQADFSSRGHGVGVGQSQSQVTNMSKHQGGPQGYGEEKKLVNFDYGDGTKQTGNFTRKEALDEIDRYRGPSRGYGKDQNFEETRKKTEPFKSDFDRYYYGNETQRSEIAGKLHRADVRKDFDSEKDFASKQFKGHSEGQDENSGGRDYKSLSDTKSGVEYQSGMDADTGMDNPQRPRNYNYQRPGNDSYQRPVNDNLNYQRPGNDNYGRPVSETYRGGSRGDSAMDDSQRHRNEIYQRTGNDSYERPSNKDYRSGSDRYQSADYQSNENDKNYRFGREYVEEYDPENWDYSGRNRGNGAKDRSMASASYSNLRESEKPKDEGKTPYLSNSDLYLKDTRNRNMETDHEGFDSRSGDSQERPDSGRSDSFDRQSPTVFDYGHRIYTQNEEVMPYRSSRSADVQEQRYDDNRYRYERENRDADRNRSSGSRNRGNERDGYYEERGEQHYNRQARSGRDYYNDSFYDRGRDERYDNVSEDYGEDMANMEEFAEEMEHIDSKSQDGGMLYEDYLFGDDDNDGEEKTEIGRESKGYGGRHFANELDRKKNVEVKKDERYGSNRNSGSDRRDTRGRDVEQRTDRLRNRDNFDERKVDHGFEKTGRNLPITDDQKAQVEKPVSVVKKVAPVQVSPSTGVPVQQVSPLTGVPTQVPPPICVPAQGPLRTGVPAQRPLQTSVPAQGPLLTSVPVHGLLPTSVPVQVPPPPTSVPAIPVTLTTFIPPPGIICKVPTSVPAIPVTLTTFIPPPGIICKDCNVTCLDQEIYNAHMKSNVHILTLQRKAQELFHMDSRKSRFDVDSTGKPLKASILPPTTMITGIPTQTLAKPTAGKQLGRNVFSGDASPEISDRHDSPTGYRSRSDSGVQVIPPKPLGPLETRSVQCTWLILQWRTRHEDEEALIDKYVVEYRNAREIRWVRVGATTKHEFEVNGLQEATDYLFRVYTTNRDERSEYLESVLVTTKKRRDSPEWGRRIPSRERERDRGRRSSGERDRRSSRESNRINSHEGDRKTERGRPHSREGDRKAERDRPHSREGDRKTEKDRPHSREGDRKPIGNRKTIADRKRIGDRKSGRDTGRVGRDSKQTKSKDGKSVKKTPSSDNKQSKAGKAGKKAEKPKEESQSAEKKTEDNPETMEVDKPVEENQEEVECLLYRELPSYVNEPMLGLDNIYEIRSYLQKTPPRYVCKLCNNKGSHKIIVKHIIGFPHKLNYFKKHNPEIYDVINVIALKKQQVERANYEAKLEEDRIGRGSVRVMLMLNPQDNNGKVVYRDPIPVKAPPPQRKKETGEVPEAYDCSYQSQFETMYNEAIEAGTLPDTTLIGLDYIKEVLHPRMEKEPKYTCSLCSVICHNTTILHHLVGKKHRFNYLKVYHQEVFEMINNAKEQKHQLLMDKIKEFAAEDGTGTIKTKVGRNERMWRDKASKAYEAQAQIEADAKSREEEEGNVEEAQPEDQGQAAQESRSSGTVQAIKFGIKKTESQPTNVKPINVLDQEQATPKHKEAFDWNKENSLLQSKIHNETIIKCSRKSKFLNVYSEFFKRYPVIGMQWVTEFQKQDIKQEPWYMCSMCQQKLQWKNILDHVTSNLHRLNYMKKSDYRQMYNAVYHAIKKDKQSARPLIEQYSKEIASTEGLPTQMEVMLELNVNTEAFKSVAKVQENVKAHASTSSSSQPTSIQINIASTSISGAKVPGDNNTFQASNEPKSAATYLSSAPAQQILAQNTSQALQLGSQVQPYNFQAPQTVQAQVQPPAMQPLIQRPPLHAPLIRPPPLYPPPSAVIPNMTYPPPSMHSGNVQRFPVATASPQLLPFQSAANAPVSAPSSTVSAIRHFAPSLVNISAAPGGQMPTMPGPFDLNTASVRQPLMPGPRLRPPLASVPVHRPPQLQPPPQMGQIPPQIPEQTQFAMPVSIQQPLIQGQPPRLPIHSSIQAPFSNAPVISGAPPVLLSDAQQAHLQDASSNVIGHRPPPWQIQTSASQIQPQTGSSYRDGDSQIGFRLSPNITDSKEMPEVNTRTQVPVKDKVIDVSEADDSNVYSKEKNNHMNKRQDYDQKRPSHAKHDNDDLVSNKNQHNADFDDRNSRNALRETDRGIKRYGRESGYSDRNKRMRNGDRVNTIKSEKRVESPKRSSSYGRLSQESDNRRDRDLRKGDKRDRRRSRSPQRYDRRRSPPRTRHRDDNFGNRPDRFTRRSDHVSSQSRDRYRESRHEERREQSYQSDIQIPSEDYNMPLNDDKVDDLVRMYCDRVDDDDYDKLMENEAEYEDINENRFDGERKDYADYERNNERYYNERETHRNYYDREKLHGGRNFGDGLNERDKTGRSDLRQTNMYDRSPDTEYRDMSNNYGPNPRRNTDMSQSNRGRDFTERAHVSDNMQRFDRHRDRVEKQEDHFFRKEENREGEFRSADEWQEGLREDDWGQREYRRNQNDRQTYSREERHRTETFNIRRGDNSDTPVHRQRYEDDDGMLYDEPMTEDDGLPDPSREEIDALLRKANDVVTQPCDDFIDYEDEVPLEYTDHQENSLAYTRGGRGGYRGRGGSRTGR